MLTLDKCERSGTSLTKVQGHRLQYFTDEFSASLTEFGEQRCVVDDVPDSISDLFEADGLVAKRSGQVLADRYHMRLLKTPREVHAALRYVLLNARRHAAAVRKKIAGKVRTKLAGKVRLDPASSAQWFDGWKRTGLDAAMRPPPGRPTASRRSAVPPKRPPVARALTWLLTVGWRRHGLLDPADVPG